MKTNFQKYYPILFIAILFVINIFIWSVVLRDEKTKELTVAFLDVGAGDSIYIEAPNGNKMLIDGGPDRGVVRELSEIIPFYERTIDVVLATHPDKDHIGGLVDVLKNYETKIILTTGATSTTETDRAFGKAIIEEEKMGAKNILVKRGSVVKLSEDILFTVLYPVSVNPKGSTNDTSIVGRLTYGNQSFLLTGDAPQKVEKYLVSIDGKKLKAKVLKIGHHGSKTSSSEVFIGNVSPDYAIISTAKKNRYGHPNKEVIDLLKKYNIPMLATYDGGKIIFKTDGETLTHN
ncbi:MAG: metallo-beta-lactamase [Parcubacteria group bacterium LiPW_30]|nr:MAG: metallo-beta-lactamase [Parcubacteria group bacterium LiPW_30]